MRILSQDGTIDMPYELTALSISYKIVGSRMDKNIFCVNAHSNSLNAKRVIMGEYSSEEKAKESMKMLHRAYVGTIYMQNTELPEGGAEELKEMVKHGFGIISVVKDTDSVRFEPLNICFQFPDDDEIEV